jgi:hypothetical protein
MSVEIIDEPGRAPLRRLDSPETLDSEDGAAETGRSDVAKQWAEAERLTRVLARAGLAHTGAEAQLRKRGNHTVAALCELDAYVLLAEVGLTKPQIRKLQKTLADLPSRVRGLAVPAPAWGTQGSAPTIDWYADVPYVGSLAGIYYWLTSFVPPLPTDDPRTLLWDDVSWGCFDQFNGVRRAAAYVVLQPEFDQFIFAVIIYNTVGEEGGGYRLVSGDWYLQY